MSISKWDLMRRLQLLNRMDLIHVVNKIKIAKTRKWSIIKNEYKIADIVNTLDAVERERLLNEIEVEML